MIIYIGADHRGYKAKEAIKRWFEELERGEWRDLGITSCVDLGASSLIPDDDYPTYGQLVGKAVAEDQKKGIDSRGIVLCGSGVGIMIAANKVPGIRAVLGERRETVKAAREDDNVNVLALSGDRLPSNMKGEVDTFLRTSFRGDEKYKKRISQLEVIEAIVPAEISDMDEWNSQKKEIGHGYVRPKFQPRDIWWCQLGKNVGNEQDGDGDRFLRPVIIISKFGEYTCLIIPLSTSQTNAWYKVPVISMGKKATALITQSRTVDAYRLVEKGGKMSKDDFDRVSKAIITQMSE
jgi:RpiB/LacA/LacB family sugar-phosphate isomerase